MTVWLCTYVVEAFFALKQALFRFLRWGFECGLGLGMELGLGQADYFLENCGVLGVKRPYFTVSALFNHISYYTQYDYVLSYGLVLAPHMRERVSITTTEVGVSESNRQYSTILLHKYKYYMTSNYWYCSNTPPGLITVLTPVPPSPSPNPSCIIFGRATPCPIDRWKSPVSAATGLRWWPNRAGRAWQESQLWTGAEDLRLRHRWLWTTTSCSPSRSWTTSRASVVLRLVRYVLYVWEGGCCAFFLRGMALRLVGFSKTFCQCPFCCDFCACMCVFISHAVFVFFQHARYCCLFECFWNPYVWRTFSLSRLAVQHDRWMCLSYVHWFGSVFCLQCTHRSTAGLAQW